MGNDHYHRPGRSQFIYNQPLLVDIGHTYNVSSAKAGQVSVLTQIGYAVGLFFIIPLADMFKRKRLMIIDFAFIVLSLLLAGYAKNINVLLIASFFCRCIMYGAPAINSYGRAFSQTKRARQKNWCCNEWLINRYIIVAYHKRLCWRAFWLAQHVLYSCRFNDNYVGAGVFLLPEVEPEYKGTYKNLMLSLVHLIRDDHKLRLAAIRGALCFACFSAFWSTLTFLLKENFNLGSDVAGLFGLVGAFGAVAVGAMGRLSDKMDPYHLSSFTLALVVISFIVFAFSGHSMVGLIIGVILMDMGVQATHISNQAIIFATNPGARNRINTIYMVTYFIGGSLGTFIATQVWYLYQWSGVCIIGICLSLIALIVHLLKAGKISDAIQLKKA